MAPRPRLHAAVTTPFRPDGEIDLDAFSAHLEWLREAGLDGVFVAGTTGEGVLLQDDEIVALVQRAAAADGLRAIAQVGRPSTRATVRLARRALEAGADAVAAYVPWFYAATEADVRGHFLALLEAAGDAPAFLYNIPRRTVNDLSPALAGELARAGFAGMKDSTADLERHEAYLDAVGDEGFELYVGAETLVLPAIERGAAGAVTGLASARPELFAALGTALQHADQPGAERAQEQITAAKAEVEGAGSTVAAVKRLVAAALAERGVAYPDAPRAPFG